MKRRSYSQTIAQAINTYMTEHDWKYQFREEEGAFSFGVSLRGKAKSLKFVLLVHDHAFTSIANYPLGADPENERELTNLALFLTYANYGMRIGNFELDMEDGDIHFKVYCNCGDGAPTEGMIEDGIHCPTAMFEKYGAGILDVLFKGTDPKEAALNCENRTRSSGLDALVRKLEAEQERKKEAESAQMEEEEEDQENQKETGISFADFIRLLEARAAQKAAEEQPEDDESLSLDETETDEDPFAEE